MARRKYKQRPTKQEIEAMMAFFGAVPTTPKPKVTVTQTVIEF